MRFYNSLAKPFTPIAISRNHEFKPQPALTDTPLASSLLADEKRREAAAERHPLKQIGAPEQFAELTDYLLSDVAKFTTGQIFRPDGGLSSVRLF